jgi:hypothetical protein
MGKRTRREVLQRKLDRLNDRIGKLLSDRAEVETEMMALLAERSDHARRRLVEVRETLGSKPGRYEVEVFAPDGQSFDGERHSLVAHGGTLAEARRTALADANATSLVDCAPDCDCKE